jgi:hypothetical protein
VVVQSMCRAGAEQVLQGAQACRGAEWVLRFSSGDSCAGGVCAPGDKVQSRCKNGGADAQVVRFRGGAEQGYR